MIHAENVDGDNFLIYIKSSTWEAPVLPLNYTREMASSMSLQPTVAGSHHRPWKIAAPAIPGI